MQELLKLEGFDLLGGPAALLPQIRARGSHVRQATIRNLLPGACAEAVCGAVQSDPRARFADAQCFLDSFAFSR